MVSVSSPGHALIEVRVGDLILPVKHASFSFVEADSPDLGPFVDGPLNFEGTFEGTVPAGQIVRAMHRAGRNKRKAMRRARGGA